MYYGLSDKLIQLLHCTQTPRNVVGSGVLQRDTVLTGQITDYSQTESSCRDYVMSNTKVGWMNIRWEFFLNSSSENEGCLIIVQQVQNVPQQVKMLLHLPQIGNCRTSHSCYSNSIPNFIVLIPLLICPKLISHQIKKW